MTYRMKMCKPPPLCRFVRPLSQTWIFGDPCDFFRLFCTSRTCSPKSVKAPEYYMLGQRSSSNNEHGRGITHKPLPSYLIRICKSSASWLERFHETGIKTPTWFQLMSNQKVGRYIHPVDGSILLTCR